MLSSGQWQKGNLLPERDEEQLPQCSLINYIFPCYFFKSMICVSRETKICRMTPSAFSSNLQLLAWEPGRSSQVTMVTVRPNFQDSVLVGYVSGLKKFTDYYTSVLCFTTPGDGPRSPPLRVHTHEDSMCFHELKLLCC